MAAKDALSDLEQQLEADGWQERRQAVQALQHAEPPDQVQRLLRKVAEHDSDPDVRASAVLALGTVLTVDTEADEYLVGRLGGETPAPIRLSAALGLLRRPGSLVQPTHQQAVWTTYEAEPEVAVQATLAKVLVGRDLDAAIRRADALLDGPDLSAIRGGALLHLVAGSGDRALLGRRLSAAAARVVNPPEAFELDCQHLAWANSPEAIRAHVEAPDVSDLRAANVVLFLRQVGASMDAVRGDVGRLAARLSGGLAAWSAAPQVLRAGLGHTYPSGLSYAPEEATAEALEQVEWITGVSVSWPEAAVALLAELAPEIPADAVPRVVDDLWHVLGDLPEVVDLLLGLQGVDGFFAELPDRSPDVGSSGLGRALLRAEDGPHLEPLREHAAVAAPHIADLLGDADWRVRQQAADWIGKRAARLDAGQVEALGQRLERLRDNDDDADVQNAARAALIEVMSQRRTRSTLPLVALLRGGDEEKALEALEALDRLPGADAPRAIVGEWVTWLALRERATLLESAAEKLRRKPSSILPLLDHLADPLPLTPELERSLRAEFTPPDVQALVDAVRESRQIGDGDRIRLRKWLGTLETGIAQSTAVVLAAEAVDRDDLEACIADELEARRRAREAEVHRRLSRHLTEMSEARFYEGDAETHERVSAQMRLHAVPLLARRLQTEEDVEVRESIATALGNLGGRAAVDALARAVAGEERTRASRQDLLSRYYLEPSKERSDEAARILTDAVADARRTLRVLQVLNFLFAGIGLTFLAVGLALLLLSTDAQLRFAGGAISVASFFGLVLQVVREPLERIQEAMNRLVQVETAFTSFIWELNLNGTFIQSQYVANGVLSNAEITDTVDRIEGAMRLSMDLVATYADQGAARIVPMIASVSPGVVHVGDRVRVRGRWLSGGRSAKRPHGGQVQLDHRVISVQVLAWTDTEVEFRFAGEALDGLATPGVRWLSLSVDGWETNALPVQVVPASAEPVAAASAGDMSPGPAALRGV